MKAAVLTLIAFCFAVGLAASGEAATTGAYTNASRVMLNPQPLPPGGKVMATTRFAAPGGKVMLNPQPLPPRTR